MAPRSKKTTSKTVYVCGECGEDQPRWFGRCPACEAWNTAREQVDDRGGAVAAPSSPAWVPREAAGAVRVRPLRDVELAETERVPTGFGEMDRVLGGGLVPGALILLGGDPGIGKSTLALQMARAICEGGGRVLYLTGEESPEQVRLRAERLGDIPGSLEVLAETQLEPALKSAAAQNPDVLVVDSIQTLASHQSEGGPGSVSQIRNCGLGLLTFAKGRRVPTLVVGHVTKDGAVAGPRVLEHMVDAVLYLEGERFHELRVLRAAKNRFGSTQELGVFEMGESGLRQVREPSRAFLGEESETPGSVVIAALQGTRPLLIEVQALVTGAGFAVPQRAGSGVPPKRLAVLLAVLEKRVGVRILGSDVFVNVAGGLELEEPAADLGIVLALAGSRTDRPTVRRLVAVGEVGLGGEVRRVGQIESRAREAELLGYRTLLVPAPQVEEARRPGIEVVGVKTVAESIEIGLGPKRSSAGEGPASRSAARTGE